MAHQFKFLVSEKGCNKAVKSYAQVLEMMHHFFLHSRKGQLKKAIINPLGVDALFVTEFYGGAGTAERSADLMDIIARLKKGDKLYIGAILGYHN